MMLLATLVRFEICWFTLGYSVFAVLVGMSIEEKAKTCSPRVRVELTCMELGAAPYIAELILLLRQNGVIEE